MSALRRLERGGYAFELTPGGSIAFHYAWLDEPRGTLETDFLSRNSVSRAEAGALTCQVYNLPPSIVENV